MTLPPGILQLAIVLVLCVVLVAPFVFTLRTDPTSLRPLCVSAAAGGVAVVSLSIVIVRWRRRRSST